MPRSVHPAAWWAWGLLLGAAAIRTTNPLLLGLLVAVVWLVVAARRRDVPWARAFGFFVKLGILVLVVRLALQAVFAPQVPGHVIATLPEVDLPGWAAGVTVGGPITAEALVQALYEGLRLVGLLVAVGAANALADPHRLLRAMPNTLYEVGVAVTVALSLAPQAGTELARVRDARRLRGRPVGRLAAVRGVAVPVLEGALDRSVSMAASMDARGFGRRAMVDPGRRRVVHAASMGGLVALAVGAYGVLDAGAPAVLGVPLVFAGSALLAAGLALGGVRSRRTRYRPDPWGRPEWWTLGSGVAALAGMVASGRLGVDLSGPVQPLELPGLPLLAAASLVVAALPALVTPEPPP